MNKLEEIKNKLNWDIIDKEWLISENERLTNENKEMIECSELEEKHTNEVIAEHGMEYEKEIEQLKEELTDYQEGTEGLKLSVSDLRNERDELLSKIERLINKKEKREGYNPPPNELGPPKSPTPPPPKSPTGQILTEGQDPRKICLIKRINEHFKDHYYLTRDDLEQFEREEYQAEIRRNIPADEGAPALDIDITDLP